jgi:hypothetical protein
MRPTVWKSAALLLVVLVSWPPAAATQAPGKTRARKLCDTVWRLEKVRDVRGMRPAPRLITYRAPFSRQNSTPEML